MKILKQEKSYKMHERTTSRINNGGACSVFGLPALHQIHRILIGKCFEIGN